VLKQYADVLLDLDFSESAFPINQGYVAKSLSSKVDISAFSTVDSTTKEFLSGSNLAYDKNSRTLEQFSFYDKASQTLDTSFVSDDEYEFAVMDYLNSYGSFFIPEEESIKMADGLQFEKVLCVLIGDDDFKPNFSSDVPPEVKQQVAAVDAEEKNVSIGVQSSNGVDLSTYKFSITIDGARL